jgi:hypothetical protein
MINIYTTYALERSVHFLIEQRSKTYKWYVLGVAQVKNVLGAKNALQEQTCFALERRGA